MGKRKQHEDTAWIKSRVCESSWPALVKKSKSYTRSCTGTVIRYKALKYSESLEWKIYWILIHPQCEIMQTFRQWYDQISV